MPVALSFTPLFYPVLFIVPLILSVSLYFLLRNKFQKKIWLWLIIGGSFLVSLIVWFIIFMIIANVTDNIDLFVKEENRAIPYPLPIMDFPEPLTLEDTSVELEKGGLVSVGATILNEHAETETYEILTEVKPDDGLSCYVDVNEISLESGKKTDIEVTVEDIDTNEKMYICHIMLLLDGSEFERTSLVIEVI